MKSKAVLTTLLSLVISYVMGQTRDCDCSAALDESLKKEIKSSQYTQLKDWLQEYYQSDDTKRMQMKSNKASTWSGSFSAIIEAIPVSGSSSATSSSGKDDQKFSRLEQKYFKNHYITNSDINELVVSEFSDNQLSAYKACLASCGVSKNGVFLYSSRESNDEFSIQVAFRSTSGAISITLAGNAKYTNMEPIDGLIFKDGYTILNGQTRTQYFKRVDLSKPASFTFNVTQGVEIPEISFSPKPSIKQEAIPIGSIVSSILDYETFLKINGLEIMDNKNMSEVLWIPCDGRNLGGVSKYAKYAGTIPDLRGVFLRGINDYKVNFGSVVAVNESQKNPENKAGGEFQIDDLKSHTHQYKASDTKDVSGKGGRSEFAWNSREYTTAATGGSETRPKNVTVYYYIKIN